VLVAEDGSGMQCLAVQPGLAGPVAVTPNGAEAWVTGSAFGAQILTRVAIVRRTSDGTIDASLPAERVSAEALGTAARPTGSFPPGGVAFTPDGATGVVTVPGEFRILLYQ
jgi:DNA-binding beta-propeller fold protein YncE